MQSDIKQAITLMSEFAERIGKGGTQRYLWTDAFALMNLLDLYRKSEEDAWRVSAHHLVDEVHSVLGRHRLDDPRQGWLSGLGEAEGARHPTHGGLRIGKPLPKRGPEEPYDERLEWDREGQYWHYLTKWMDALSRAALVLDTPRYQAEAEDLASATFPRFVQRGPDGTPLGLAWKMSVDLSHAQVATTSPHDALDGYVTFRWLRRAGAGAGLEEGAWTLREMAGGQTWATGDPLGVGGLLLDAMRLALLPDRTVEDETLIGTILAGCDAGLAHIMRSGMLNMPPEHRLGFREIGLGIGLQALPAIVSSADASDRLTRAVSPHLDRLRSNAGVGQRIIGYWSKPENRRAATWVDHRDINEVMLATALLGAYVGTAVVPPASTTS